MEQYFRFGFFFLHQINFQGDIVASQKIEHYEIASYGILVAFAKTLGEEAALLLEATLAEEKDADVTLTGAAYNTINFDAVEE